MKKLKDKRFDTLATNSAMAQSHEISRVEEEAEEKIIKEYDKETKCSLKNAHYFLIFTKGCVYCV